MDEDEFIPGSRWDHHCQYRSTTFPQRRSKSPTKPTVNAMRIHAQVPPPHVIQSQGPSAQVLAELRRALPSTLATNTVEYSEEVVVLSQRARSVLWYTVLLLILSNVVVLGAFAIMYSQNEQYESLLWTLRIYFLFSDATTFLYNYSMGIAIGYGILCATFAFIAIRTTWMAFARKRFRIGHRFVQFTKTTHRINIPRTSSTSPIRASGSLPTRIKHAIIRARRSIGVRGPYFELRFVIEEWFELGTQTFAAYSASRSISDKPLNVTYGIVIFLNSISSIAYTRIFPTSLVKQRLACVVTDLLLDFVWGTLLPVWMYVPIIQRYLGRGSIMQDLISFAGFTRSVERNLILSWRSYAVSILPFLSSLVKLLDLQNILRDLRPARQCDSNGRTERRTFVHVGRRKHSWLPHLAHMLMPLYGFGILITSFAASNMFSNTPSQSGVVCGYRVHPWFSTEEACLQRQLNCMTLGIEGEANELNPILDRFERSTLSEIFFMNCPALEMPSTIRHFQRLLTLYIVNSTVVTWDTTAELSDPYFQDLRTVQIYSVRFVQDPIGLTGHQPLATTLEWIHIEEIDGPRILSLVGHHWYHLQAIGLLNCGLTIFPDVMYAMPNLRMVSLRDNDIPFIPDDWLQRLDLHLEMFNLNGNPRLTQLPDSVWRQAATCGIFTTINTNLSVVPDWLPSVASPIFQVAASGSPVCEDVGELPSYLRPFVFCG